MTAAGHQCSCCSGPVSSVHQTLDEMDFERGLLDFNRSDIVIDFLHLKPSPSPWGVCVCVCARVQVSGLQRCMETCRKSSLWSRREHIQTRGTQLDTLLWWVIVSMVTESPLVSDGFSISSSNISNLVCLWAAALCQPRRSPQRVLLSSGGRRLCVPPNSRWGDATAPCCVLWTRRCCQTAAAAQS